MISREWENESEEMPSRIDDGTVPSPPPALTGADLEAASKKQSDYHEFIKTLRARKPPTD